MKQNSVSTKYREDVKRYLECRRRQQEYASSIIFSAAMVLTANKMRSPIATKQDPVSGISSTTRSLGWKGESK